MPPKKAAAEELTKPLLGRPGNNVKAGVVGLPNVGKSSLFNVLCSMEVRAENFPFCTIDPTVARVAVPDERFDFLCQTFKPAKEIPAYLNVTDIAGLIKGASQGEGLGNAFLSHISACDAIFHVVRVFDDADILHVEDTVDPVRDIAVISDELRLKDIETMKKEVTKLEPIVARGIDKTKKAELEFAKKVLDMLEDGKEIRFGDWTAKEVDLLNTYFLITAKPVIYLLNLSEKDFLRRKNKWLPKIVAWLKENKPGEPIIPVSVVFEEKVSEMSADERKQYFEECGQKSALPKIITLGYEKLNLINFFTCGKDEVRSWTIRANTKAAPAAAVIHTDFEKHFIMAEVMGYEDFKAAGSEANVVSNGKLQQRGKDYLVKNGDILNIKHNAGGGKKK